MWFHLEDLLAVTRERVVHFVIPLRTPWQIDGSGRSHDAEVFVTLASSANVMTLATPSANSPPLLIPNTLIFSDVLLDPRTFSGFRSAVFLRLDIGPPTPLPRSIFRVLSRHVHDVIATRS